MGRGSRKYNRGRMRRRGYRVMCAVRIRIDGRTMWGCAYRSAGFVFAATRWKEKKKVNRPKRERGAFLKTFWMFCFVLLPRFFFAVSSRKRRRYTRRDHRYRFVRPRLEQRSQTQHASLRGADTADDERRPGRLSKVQSGDGNRSVFSVRVNQ